MNQITGTAVVLVSKYTNFDPLKPQATKAHRFVFADADVLNENGALTNSWGRDGYIYVGHAAIQITLLPANDIAARAVETLKQQKTQVLADAQAEATQIEGRIQSLLAIAN